MDYPILHDPGSIELLMTTVNKTTPPRLVDHDYLIGLGFKREVDEGLLKLLAFLAYIDENGQPSILWQKSLDPKQAPIVLGKAVRAAYGSLFSEFPNAYNEDGSVLMEFFKRNTEVSDPNAAYMILTFKVLCDLADISGSEPVDAPRMSAKEAPVAKAIPGRTEPAKIVKPAESPGQDCCPPLRISINIDLDEKSDPDLRDLAMKLLKKQLEL